MSVLGSRAFIRKIIASVRASYWFWPSTLVIGALLLAEATVWIDGDDARLPFALPERLTAIDAAGARDILSTLAGAVIGVAGVMFSMTLVAVSFAADTFGPRLIGNFMRDRKTQISFGLLLGTFVFNVVILRSVQDGETTFVPYLGLAMALALTLMAVFTIIYYIHHVPETINVSNIASGLGHRFSGGIRSLIDERAARQTEDVTAPDGTPEHAVGLDSTGYIQQMDDDALFASARDNGWIINVCYEVGDFITPHATVLTVLADQPPTQPQIKSLQDAFATGDARTEAQSVTFLADQLVEMIARALSPGLNDPFTAMNCLNWLHAGLLDALLYRDGLGTFRTPRVRFIHVDFVALFEAGFVAAAPYTVTDRMCRLRHLALARDLLKHATGNNRRVIADLCRALQRPADEIRL